MASMTEVTPGIARDRTTTRERELARAEKLSGISKSSEYIELRTRSAFSFLEGATAPEDLARYAAAFGYPAMAMGDRDGVYGHPRFFQGARAVGIRSLVGAELTLDDESRLYVLVPDRERYRNLCRMITASKLRVIGSQPGGAPQYPAKGESRITLDDLER